MKGILFLIVGPSGAGKDTLLAGARERFVDDPRFVYARRVITRPADAGGEDHEAVDEAAFEQRVAAGEFLAHWKAHGLGYGLPASLEDELARGRHVLANVSRGTIAEISARYDNLRVIEVTAPPRVLAERLTARRREDPNDIEKRLRREVPSYPDDVEVLSVINDGTPEEGVKRFVQAIGRTVPGVLRVRRVAIDTWHENICFLHRDCEAYHAADYLGTGKVDIFAAGGSVRAKVNVVEDEAIVSPEEVGLSVHAFQDLGFPEGAEVMLERTPSPESIDALRAKVAGAELRSEQMHQVISDIAEDRYTDKEIAAFLVAAARELTTAEIESLTRARAEYGHQFHWNRKIVVDKHSMGGIPGSRISMIVIPIVAAHGLTIPKTSSRAITSAAGTADAMESLARVDLTPAEVQRVVEDCNGCIAWNGRLNHSPIDDVMNSITRPLGIDSTKWAVASILSKKLAAGATHAIIDIPVGRYAKVRLAREGRELSRLFEEVGAGVGITVTARVTDGSRPVGRGIGPALEVRDVYRVLRNDPAAPADLREKALGFAASILEWDPELVPGSGRARAAGLLESGAALAAFERIVDRQGRRDRPDAPGALVHEVLATRGGAVEDLDSYRMAEIARRAGAPMDRSAGIDLLKGIGDEVSAGDPLYLVHANVETDFRVAVDFAEVEPGFLIV